MRRGQRPAAAQELSEDEQLMQAIAASLAGSDSAPAPEVQRQPASQQPVPVLVLDDDDEDDDDDDLKQAIAMSLVRLFHLTHIHHPSHTHPHIHPHYPQPHHIHHSSSAHPPSFRQRLKASDGSLSSLPPATGGLSLLYTHAQSVLLFGQNSFQRHFPNVFVFVSFYGSGK
jgi:hypothetical protein